MKHLRLAAVLGAVLAIAVAGTALGHTGSISKVQNCQYGTRIFAHLDSNVAASATYVVKINGSTVASGNGPGPKDLGPYNAGFGAGTASLRITFNQEVNTYPVEFGAVQPCPTPTPSPTPTPTPTPSPTPSATPSPTPSPSPSATPSERPTPTPSTPPLPTPTPNLTLPPTATGGGTGVADENTGRNAALLVIFVLAIAMVAAYIRSQRPPKSNYRDRD